MPSDKLERQLREVKEDARAIFELMKMNHRTEDGDE